jgi:hypothetical protein
MLPPALRRPVLCSCALIAALPLSPLAAARLADGSSVINFAVVPGTPLLRHQRPQFSFTLQAAPGHLLHDYVAVANGSTTTPLTVRLSVSDAVTPPKGAGLSYSDGGVQHQIGLWTQLSAMTVTVSPNAATLVPITVRVPSSARPGDYEGSIAATTVSGLTLTQGRARSIFHFTQRCLVYLRVLGHASAGLRIAHVGFMTAPNKRAVFGITLTNTGTLIDRPATSLVTLIGSRKTYTVRPLIGMITAGASTIVGFDLGQAVPAGTYTVRIAIIFFVRPTYAGPYQQLQTTWTGHVVVAGGFGK